MNAKFSKIGVSVEADQSLDRILNKVNDGFTGGRVTKSDLASWILKFFETHTLENVLDKIRKDHFDQVAYLESVLRELKQARKAGTTTPDLPEKLAQLSAKQGSKKQERS